MNCKSMARLLGVVWMSVLMFTVEAQAWQIDEAQTTIGFAINAVGFPTTHGHFAHYHGRLLIDFDRPAKSYTTFTVDATSVEVGSPSFNDFVKSPALLDVERFPTMNFVSTQVEKVDGHTARVTGNLTLLGITKPFTLMVESRDRSQWEEPGGRLFGKRPNSTLRLRHEVRRSADRRHARDHRENTGAIR
jgi:polyisoprenoid-binding protein YceI